MSEIVLLIYTTKYSERLLVMLGFPCVTPVQPSPTFISGLTPRCVDGPWQPTASLYVPPSSALYRALLTSAPQGSRLVLNLRAEAMSDETTARPPPQMELRARRRHRTPTGLVFRDPGEYRTQGLSQVPHDLSAHQFMTSRVGLDKETSRGAV